MSVAGRHGGKHHHENIKDCFVVVIHIMLGNDHTQVYIHRSDNQSK